MAQILHVASREVRPHDMLEGLFVREVHEEGSAHVAEVATLTFECGQVEGRCVHVPVWGEPEVRRLPSTLTVVRGFKHPRPDGCTCA